MSAFGEASYRWSPANFTTQRNLPSFLASYILNGSDGLHYHDVFNDVFGDFKKSLYTYNQPRNIILISIYVIVFLLSFGGNILVILVIVANRALRSVTNYFLLNLAVADLLVTIVCIPLTVGGLVYKAWIYGLVLCKATGYLQGVSIAASVLTIMGLALDRYLVLSHPVRARRLSTPGHARLVLMLIWLLAGSIMIPLVVVRHLAIHPLDPEQSLAFCHERWPDMASRRTYDVFLFFFIYVVPGVVVTASYAATGCSLMTTTLHRQNSDTSQSQRILAGRRRVARMLLGLAGLFACSWLPYHIVSLHLDFKDEEDKQYLAALSFALLAGHCHSAQNPILYCIMNSSLKRAMMRIIFCRKIQTFRSKSETDYNHSRSRPRTMWSLSVSQVNSRGRRMASRSCRSPVPRHTETNHQVHSFSMDVTPHLKTPSPRLLVNNKLMDRSSSYGMGHARTDKPMNVKVGGNEMPLNSLAATKETENRPQSPGLDTEMTPLLSGISPLSYKRPTQTNDSAQETNNVARAEMDNNEPDVSMGKEVTTSGFGIKEIYNEEVASSLPWVADVSPGSDETLKKAEGISPAGSVSDGKDPDLSTTVQLRAVYNGRQGITLVLEDRGMESTAQKTIEEAV